MFELDEKVMADNRTIITIQQSKDVIDRLVKNGTINYTADTNDLYLTIPLSKDSALFNRVIQEASDGKIPRDLDFAGNITIDKGLVVQGNLTVNGTTTTLNTTTTTVEDNIIELNKSSDPSYVPLTTGGIQMNRGSNGNANWLFEEISDRLGHTSFVNDINGTILSWLYDDGLFKTLGDIDTQNLTAHKNISGLGNLSIALDTTLSGKLDVTLATILRDSLQVNGAATFNNNMNIYGTTHLIKDSSKGSLGNLIVDNSTQLNDILSVAKATTLNSTLDVKGSTLLENILEVTGNTVLDSNLDAKGPTHIYGILTADSAVNLGSTLTVSGATTINNTFTVANTYNTTLGKDLLVKGILNVSGNSNLTGNLTIASAGLEKAVNIYGTATISQWLSVGGNFTVADGKSIILGGPTTIKGAATLNSSLTVTGAAQINNILGVTGAVTLGSTLSVADNVTLTKDIAVGGNATITGTLTTTGDTVFNGNVDIKKNLITEGNSSTTGTQTVTGIFTANNTSNLKATNITGNLHVTGTSTLDGATLLGSTLDVTGITHLKNTTTIDGATTLNDNLSVVKAVTVGTTLTVTGNAILQSNASVSGILTSGTVNVTSTLGVGSDANIAGNLNVTTDSLLSGNLHVIGTSNLDGIVTAPTINAGTITVTGISNLQNVLNVTGASNLNSSLTVTGATLLQSSLDVNGVTNIHNTLTVDNPTHLKGDLTVDTLGQFTNSILVGSLGSILKVDTSTLTYKGNQIWYKGSGDINFDITTINAATKGIVWNGLTDTHKIFVEEYGGSESTRLVIYSSDGGDVDYTVFRSVATTTPKDVFEIHNTYVAANSVLNANSGIYNKGSIKLDGTLSSSTYGQINSPVAVHFSNGTSTAQGIYVKNIAVTDVWTDGDANLVTNGIYTKGGIKSGGQITSTVVSGTAPLVVASSTMVNNLNSERTNGYKIYVQNTAPASPQDGDVWIDTSV